MSCSVRLVLALHNHQPVGNFDGVFEAAYNDSYMAFLDVLQDYPEISIVLHTSGSLMEWLVDRHPEYIDRVRALVKSGQVEILGGPFYEPILACIPGRDRIGQTRKYKEYLEDLFDTVVRGMWVPERVWEQSFTSDLGAAAMEYTILDDFHFRCAGLEPDDLHGYYLTEDEGSVFKIFAGSETLRYTIPFRDPEETIGHLRSIAERKPGSIVTFGDDGEKFGTWPETRQHVYEDGWLRRFLDALRANNEWLQTCTLANAVDHVSPVGRCYLPDASYREMTEWALPTASQSEYTQLAHRHDLGHEFDRLKRYARGGFWRNFLVKYPESNEMYARVLEVSRRIADVSQVELKQDGLIDQARTEMYRAQCNCPYWHGAFGGLYLPHLRNAIYSHVIAADNLLEQAAGRTGQWVRIDVDDFNLDARKEVRMASDRLVAYIAPATGGHMYELDVRTIRTNLMATLNRRPEPYHDKIIAFARNGGHRDNSDVASIHDMIRLKQPDLDQKIAYDKWPRKSLVDHFFAHDADRESFARGEGTIDGFEHGVFQTRLRRTNDCVETVLSREAVVDGHRIRITKTIGLNTESSGTLSVAYRLEQLPQDATLHFGVEFNFAAIPAGATDRYFYGADGQQLGQIETELDLRHTRRIGLVDEWLGVDVSLDFSRPSNIWSHPIQTVSGSEAGFELVHQNVTVLPHWQVTADDSGAWEVTIELSADTSAAQARLLGEATVTG
jgi:hypothetical protein